MSRALFSPHLPAVLVAVCIGGGCNSDDPYMAPIDPTTGPVDPTEIPVFTTGEPDDTGVGTTFGPSDETCRGALTCVVQCLIVLDPGIEPDTTCILPCIEPLSTPEWLKVIDLSECVALDCNNKGQCGEAAEGDSCRECLFAGLIAENPPVAGCEAQSAECG